MVTLKRRGWSRRIRTALVLVFLLVLSTVLSGCFDRNHCPVAVITATPTSGEAPLEVTLDASQSHDTDGDEITYEWDFGDGEVAQGETIQHGFGTPGSYTVNLQVTDSKGKSVTETEAISVSRPPDEVTKQQTFDLQNGLEYDTGTGLKASIPPAQTKGKANLMVTENPTPQQRVGEYIELTSVYEISLAQGDTYQDLRAISEASVQSQNIELTFELSSSVDSHATVILEWTNEGWALAENQQGLPGGDISPDGTHISLVCKHLSRYALATWLYQHIFSHIDSFPSPPPLDPIFNRGKLSTNDKGEQILECTLKSPAILSSFIAGPVGGIWYYVSTKDAEGLDAVDLKVAGSWYNYDTVNTKLLPPGGQWNFRFEFESTGGECKVCLDSESPDVLSVSAADWAERLGLLPEKASLLISGVRDLPMKQPGSLSAFRTTVWAAKKVMLTVFYEALKESGVKRAKYLINLVPVSINIATYISSRYDGRPDPCFEVSVEGTDHLPGPFKVGDVVKVVNTGDAGLNLRDAPAGKILTTVPNGWVFKVIEGSKSAVLDGKTHRWWKVRAEEYEPTLTEGWVAEDFITKVSPEALAPPSPPDYFLFSQGRVDKAIEWAKGKQGSKDWYDQIKKMGYCLRFVSQAFGLGREVNADTTAWESPRDAIQELGSNFHASGECRNPPKGAMVFFSAAGKFSPYWHVGIYLGDGKVVHAYGTVRVQPLSGDGGIEQLSYIGSYIGWAYPPREWLKAPNQLPNVTITSPTDGLTFNEGDPITFQGKATDPEDGALTGSSLVWTSSIDGQIGIGESLITSSLPVGTHTITLTATDSDGYSALTSINITIGKAEPTPQVEPSQAKIAFTSHRDSNDKNYAVNTIYVMNADGSHVQWLTDGSTPAWAPDGTRIAFASDRDSNGHLDIYIMNADGSEIRRLTNNPADDWQPTWSPDGTRIAFASDRNSNGHLDIYIMNADGTNQHNITNNPASNDKEPAWSPDGTKIAFASDRNARWVNSCDIYVMDTDGSNVRRISNFPLYGNNDLSLAWSPDGTKIAFDLLSRGGRPVDAHHRDIYVMNADGSDIRRLTNNPAGDFEPTWSPDGTKIGFTSDRDWNLEIYVMDADGSNQHNISNNSADDWEPAWSPVLSTTTERR